MRWKLFFVAIISLVLGFMGGIYLSDAFVVFGRVDFLSGGDNEVVELTRDVYFKKPGGGVDMVKKGQIFYLEGRYDFQSYLSRRYIINDPGSYKVISSSKGYDYFQEK